MGQMNMNDTRAAAPAVDVVVLSWNRPAETMETLDSVLAQEQVRVRLWVVDQGSHPSQVADLRALSGRNPAVQLIELGRNVGVPAGRNIGVRAGSADWVVSLDNDAVFASPGAMATAVSRLVAFPRVGAVAFRAEDYSTGDLDRTSWVYPSALETCAEPVPVARFVGVGHALRRSAFEAAGGYDERLFFCEEELDLSYRVIDRGYRILYDPSIVIRHKVSPASRVGWTADRVYYQTRNAVLVHHRHYRSHPITLSVAGGWLMRAAYNGKPWQALRGLRDAARMWRDTRDLHPPLGPDARRYIREHDTRLRGSPLARLRREVLAGLPNERASGENRA
jgi:GT2 family glycosyltransferase